MGTRECTHGMYSWNVLREEIEWLVNCETIGAGWESPQDGNPRRPG